MSLRTSKLKFKNQESTVSLKKVHSAKYFSLCFQDQGGIWGPARYASAPLVRMFNCQVGIAEVNGSPWFWVTHPWYLSEPPLKDKGTECQG
jgi:hypothetical protein